MNIRAEALVALLFAAAVTVAATAGVAAMTVLDPAPELPRMVIDDDRRTDDAFLTTVPQPSVERGAVLSGTRAPTASPAPTATAVPTPTPPTEVAGIGSNYPGTAGWMEQATVAMPGDLGGQYNGEVNGHVTVCADRCVRFPVVDWCQCYWGTDDQRVVDLSHSAWALVSDAPLAEGLIEVRVILER